MYHIIFELYHRIVVEARLNIRFARHKAFSNYDEDLKSFYLKISQYSKITLLSLFIAYQLVIKHSFLVLFI
jgi:hypothetical protein